MAETPMIEQLEQLQRHHSAIAAAIDTVLGLLRATPPAPSVGRRLERLERPFFTRRPAEGIAGTPAIDRLTPEERAVFVRLLAEIALKQALADIEAEAADTENGDA
jgi:hypothetical protein